MKILKIFNSGFFCKRKCNNTHRKASMIIRTCRATCDSEYLRTLDAVKDSSILISFVFAYGKKPTQKMKDETTLAKIKKR